MSGVLYGMYKRNKLMFGKMYLGHYFSRESPAFHIHIIDEIGKSLNIAIQAPRGSAKSTIGLFLNCMHGIIFKSERFIIIVQDTWAKANAALDSIKAEFRDNELLKEDFGIGMDRKDAQGDTIFTHPDGYSVRVLCKGADQLGSIRGEKFGAYRPTLLFVDDLEDDELVRSSDRREMMEREFNDVLKYAGEFGVTRTVVIGTILHDDSLMAKLMSADRYKNFRKVFYRARMKDDSGNDVSIWNEKWSLDDLKDMEADDPVGFAKEMQGDPSMGSLETIRREDFRYWSIVEGEAVLYGKSNEVIRKWGLKECRAAIAVDLAWEDKKASDYSAIVPGFVTPGNDILVNDYIARRGIRPDELEEIIFEMSSRYEALTGKRVQIGFEKAKLEKVMKWFLGEAQRRRNKWLWFKDVSWGTKDKIERIMGRIANRYAQHSVYHRRGMGELENQLIRLRSSAHDDLCDCVGMLPEMLAYAPNVVKPVKTEDRFDFLRRQTSVYRDKNKSSYVFGRGIKPSFVRTIQGI